MRELGSRVLTSVVLIAMVLGLLLLAKAYDNAYPIALLAVVVTFICSMEFADLFDRLGLRLERVSLVLFNLAYITLVILFDGQYALWALTAALLWPLLWNGIRRASAKLTLASWFGLFYIPMLLQFAYLVVNAANGVLYLAFLLASVWAYDICAFFVGSIWGREKLLPEVSPGKTWEGVLGGTAAVLVVNLTAPAWLPGIDWSWQWVPMVLYLSIATQLGDLFESWLKRAARIKDAGVLLPGHGGLLDRIDGLLLASPVFYFYLRYVLHLL